jgi:hypothetical protein
MKKVATREHWPMTGGEGLLPMLVLRVLGCGGSQELGEVGRFRGRSGAAADRQWARVEGGVARLRGSRADRRWRQQAIWSLLAAGG